MIILNFCIGLRLFPLSAPHKHNHCIPTQENHCSYLYVADEYTHVWRKRVPFFFLLFFSFCWRVLGRQFGSYSCRLNEFLYCYQRHLAVRGTKTPIACRYAVTQATMAFHHRAYTSHLKTEGERGGWGGGEKSVFILDRRHRFWGAICVPSTHAKRAVEASSSILYTRPPLQQ